MLLRWRTIMVLGLLGLSNTAYRARGDYQAIPASNRQKKSEGAPKEQNPLLASRYQSPFSVLTDYFSSPSAIIPLVSKDMKGKVDFLFAIVPDPEHADLALEFDRAIESILRAVNNSQFTFDSSWFPWTGEAAEGDPEKRKIQLANHEQRRQNPGLLLFRREEKSKFPNDLLAVLLIAEAPDSGIDRKEFANALSLFEAIRPNESKIFALAPTYSGSFPSLAASIKDAKHPFRVISGTATHQELEATFAGEVPEYNSVVYSDEFAFKALQNYLRNELRAKDDTIAILSEDATPFGGQYSRGGKHDKVLNLRFPREISRIRSAYASGDAAEKSLASRPPADSGSLLPLKWQDERSTSSAVPTFSVQQTPSSQEAVLLDLAATLVRERTQIVVINATDVLDELFLAQFLRKHVSDIRLCFLDADLLFVHAAQSLQLEGVLLVTTYPLHNRNQYWISGRSYWDHQDRIVFPSQDAEGIYNACRALLLEKYPYYDPAPDNPPLLDYSWAEDRRRPPLWLTVVGRDGNYPVARIQPEFDNLLFSLKNKLLYALKNDAPKPNAMEPNPPSGLWMALFYILVTAGFCLSLLIGIDLVPQWLRRLSNPVLKWLDGLISRLPGWLVTLLKDRLAWRRKRWAFVFAVRPNRSEAEYQDDSKAVYRALYLEVLGLSFLAFYFLFTLPLVGFWLRGATAPVNLIPGTMCIYVLAPVFLMLALVVRFSCVFEVRRKEIFQNWRFWLAIIFGIIFGLMFVALLCVLWRVVFQTGYDEGFFFLYRSLLLTSGVSPVLPMMIVVTALWHCGWIHFQRHVFILEWRPEPPYLGNEPSSKRMNDLKNEVDRHAEAFFPDLRQLIPAVLLLLVVLIWFTPWKHPRAFEFRYYNDLFVCSIALLFTLIYFTWLRFIDFWAALCNFLNELERHPLRHAFSRLPPEYSWSPVWRSGWMRPTFIFLTRTMECLRAIMMENGIEQSVRKSLGAAKQPELEAAAADLLDRVGKGEVETAAERKRVRKALSAIGTILSDHLREEHWPLGDSDSYRELRKRKSGEETIDEEKAELNKSRPVILMEEFLALGYVAYIRYALVQLRNLLSFVVCGFILALLSLYSYPFQARQFFGVVGTAVFLILGAGMTRVFMQMDRHPLLSRISKTVPGHLDWDFFRRVVGYGALPLLTLLAGHFPSISNFLTGLVEPVLEAMR